MRVRLDMQSRAAVQSLRHWTAQWCLLLSGSSSSWVESGQLLSHARVGNPERSDGMRGDEILLLGIEIQPPSQKLLPVMCL